MKNALLACMALAVAAASGSSAPFETAPPSAASRWKRASRAPPDARLSLHIPLAAAKPGLIEQHAYAIGDPGSASWRRHLSSAEVAAAMAPAEGASAAVLAWLRAAGIPDARVDRGGAVAADASVAAAERLLNATYHVYVDPAGGAPTIRTREYYVPAALQEHVRFVAPTVHFPHASPRVSATRRRRSSAGAGAARGKRSVANSTLEAACLRDNQTYVSPQCFRTLYDIDYNATSPNTTVGILDNFGGGFNNSDFQLFLKTWVPAAYAAHATFTTIFGPNASNINQQSFIETMIDTETSLGLAYPATGIHYIVNNNGTFGNATALTNAAEDVQGEDEFLAFLNQIVHNDTVAGVISLSAGGNENQVPPSYAQQVCTLIGAAGARGVTFIASTGDDGPIASPSTYHDTPIDPEFYATCPFVLAVGATVDPFDEVAAVYATQGGTTSGGGFSTLFPRPDYQKSVCDAYIANNVSSSFQAIPGFNATGRGYPDVSALGVDGALGFQGRISNEAGGTSMAAPAWAGMIALLNDYEASQGRPTLGFVNPWLYSLAANGTGFKDITVGTGLDFGTQIFSTAPYLHAGYNATVGWDALTGLGTPIFSQLRAALG